MTTNHESQQRTRSYLKMPRGGFAEDYHAHSCELKRVSSQIRTSKTQHSRSLLHLSNFRFESDEPEELNDPEDRREPEDAEEQEPEEPVDPKHEEPGKHGERLDENPGNDESSGTPEDHEYPAQDHREHPSGRGDILQQISNGWNPKDFLCYCCYKKSLHLLREWSRSTLPIETRPQRIPPGSTWSIERGIPLPPHPGHPYSTASRAGTRMSRELFASNPYLIPPLISLRSRPLRFHSPSLASDSIRSPPHSRAPPFHNPYSSHRSSNKSESSRPFLPHASASLALASHAPPSLAASHQHPNLALIHQPPPRLSTSSSNPLPPPRNHPYAQGRCFENKVHPRHPPYAYNSQTQQPRRACAQKGPIPRDRNRFAVTLGWPVYDHHITTARHSKHKRNTLREFEAPQPAAARAPAAYAQEGSSQEKTSQRSRRKRGRSEKNIACTYCNKRFKYLGNLKNHIRTHTGERPFKCSICTKGFAQISNLRRHRKTHEKKSKKKRTT